MAGGIKIRAKETGGVTRVRVLIKHPMETGIRKNSKTGELIPAHYIQEVMAEYQGRIIIQGQWGPAVSKNPYWSFKFKGGRKGDSIRITWTDNRGETGTEEGEIK